MGDIRNWIILAVTANLRSYKILVKRYMEQK